MTFFSTNTLKDRGDGTPKALRGVVTVPGKKGETDRQTFAVMNGVQPREVKRATGFNFDAPQFTERRPHQSAFKKGPLQTAMLREMAENKARMAAAAAKKAADARATAKGKPKAKAKGRKRAK